MYAARMIANEFGPGTGAHRRVGIPGQVEREIVSGYMKAEGWKQIERTD
jgi:hypothetical protein